jgi:hypothetical protein
VRIWWALSVRTAALLWRFYARTDLLVGFAILVGGTSTTALLRLIPSWGVLVGIAVFVLYALVLAIYSKIKETEDEKAALEGKLATAKKRRAVNNLLGNALEEGLRLKQGKRYAIEGESQELEEIEIGNEGQARYDEEVRAWVDRTYDLIDDALGRAEAQRFISNEGYTDEEVLGRKLPSSFSVSSTQRKYLIPARLKRLHELIDRMHNLDINPDFDPDEWKNR